MAHRRVDEATAAHLLELLRRAHVIGDTSKSKSLQRVLDDAGVDYAELLATTHVIAGGNPAAPAPRERGVAWWNTRI